MSPKDWALHSVLRIPESLRQRPVFWVLHFDRKDTMSVFGKCPWDLDRQAL